MFYIDKLIGETPLQALQRFRDNHPEYTNKRLSYAGRLDPMAKGKLLILEGQENERREEFLNQDKTYEFQILFGVSTDTFDLLGMVTEIAATEISLTAEQLNKVLNDFVGEWDMTYPPYSSKTVEVNGSQQQLWKLAREGNISDLTLPQKSVEVHKLACRDIQTIKKNYIIYYIIKNIAKVEGDFRQERIIHRWQEVLRDVNHSFKLASCYIHCSSGTYIRRLAHEVGKLLEHPALAFSINRTTVSTE